MGDTGADADDGILSELPERYPARRFFGLMGDKWTPVVLYCLASRVRRFNELHASIPGISKKMLVQVLRSLERDGLVQRTVYPVAPPHTDYRLTPLGQRVHEPIALVCSWAVEHETILATIEANRDQARRSAS